MNYCFRLSLTTLVLIILAAAWLPGAPVLAAPPGETHWRPQSAPGLDGYVIYSGSNGTDFAESPATGRVYILDRGKSVVKTGTEETGWVSVTGTAPGFTWTSISGAESYRFILATDAALNQPVAGTPVTLPRTSYQVSGLEPGTTYFWGVTVLEPTPGVQTIATFTTADAPSGAVDTPPAPVDAPVKTVAEEPPAPEAVSQVPAPVNSGSLLPDVAVWAIVGIGAALVLAVLVLVVAVVILVVRVRPR